MIRQIDAGYAVSGQISTAHLKELVDAGFKAVVNNRPDGEDPAQQTPSKDMEAAAKALGLHYVYIPVGAAHPVQQAAVTLREALTHLPRPVLAYCRSGARSETVYTLAKAAP